MTADIEIYEKDVVDVLVSWTTPAGAVKDIAGGTLETLLEKRGAGTVVSTSATIASAVAGTVTLPLDGTTLSAGSWKLQHSLTIGTDTQTQEYCVNVLRSIPTP